MMLFYVVQSVLGIGPLKFVEFCVQWRHRIVDWTDLLFDVLLYSVYDFTRG